jgi:hypothetical protein
MVSQVFRICWYVIAGAAIVIGSFFGTLWLITPTYEAALPLVSSGQMLEFSNGKNSTALIDGWSASEAWGHWSDGTSARFGSFVSGSVSKVSVSGRAFLPPQMPQQTVEVWAGRMLLKTLQISVPEVTFDVPLTNVSVNPLVLTFISRAAKSPKELGISEDTRALTFGISSIKFER